MVCNFNVGPALQRSFRLPQGKAFIFNAVTVSIGYGKTASRETTLLSTQNGSRGIMSDIPWKARSSHSCILMTPSEVQFGLD